MEKASELARRLVKQYGMSEKLGPVVFGAKEELIFLGKEIGEQRNYSEQTAVLIDQEVARFIENAKKTAQKILAKRRRVLSNVAKELTEKETLEREEFEKIVGKKIKKRV